MSGERGHAIARICAALGLQASGPQQAALVGHLELLLRWNTAFNLTGARDGDTLLTQHLADCLAAVLPLRRHAGRGRLLDVGSGGGLPGAVLAIMLPEWDVTCVDAVGKKAAFVRQLAGAWALPNLHSVHARVEHMGGPPYDAIVTRAFSSLHKLVTITRPLLSPRGVWMAMKGKVPVEEIAGLPEDTAVVFHVEHLKVPGLDVERCLVWMRPPGEADAAARTDAG